MRSSSIYRQKNIRAWKVNNKAINCILSFDKIIKEDVNRLSFVNDN